MVKNAPVWQSESLKLLLLSDRFQARKNSLTVYWAHIVAAGKGLITHRGSWQRTHPATRTFQALRIAVNDELGQLETLLRCIPDLLTVGGRVGILSFHSLEDRLVKRFFKEHAEAGYEADLDVLTKKPIDGATHDVHNPRSRSAKLRVAVKK